jgi:hypothetical protein
MSGAVEEANEILRGKGYNQAQRAVFSARRPRLRPRGSSVARWGQTERRRVPGSRLPIVDFTP